MENLLRSFSPKEQLNLFFLFLYLLQLLFMAFRTLNQGALLVFLLLSYPHLLLFGFNVLILHPSCLQRQTKLNLCNMTIAQYALFILVLGVLAFELISSYDYIGV